jgi:hypothetical protein
MKNVMGRHRIIVDWEKVDKYLQAQCDGVSVASILGISADTLYLRCVEEKEMTFTAYSAKKKAEGVQLLKAKQFQTAMSGNVTMQIWLGKQYAGQREKAEVMNTGLPNISVVVDSPETARVLKELLAEEVKDPSDADPTH